MTVLEAGEVITRGGPSASYADSTAGASLAGTLGELARTLRSETTQADTVQAIVTAAVDTVPGAQYASIAVIRHDEAITLVATDDAAAAVDRAQYDEREGPCLDVLYRQRTIRLSSLTTEARWPKFIQRATQLGVGSLLAVQLYVQDGDLGVLSMFSNTPHAFGDESEDVALLFATHAAVAMAGADEKAQLRQAIDTRDLIGQAKGILMERFTLTSDQAFQLLVHVSQHTNDKLISVAEALVFSGALPEVNKAH